MSGITLSLIGAAVRGVALLGSRAPVPANTVVTNVPGSPVPLYFLGCEMVRSTGCVPLVDGVGLFHCVTSFCGVFTFMFTADRDLMPDPEVYRRHLEVSIAEHLAAAADRERAASVKPSGGSAKKAAAKKTAPKPTGVKRATAKKIAAKKTAAKKPAAKKSVTKRPSTRKSATKPPAVAVQQAAAG